MKFIQTNLDICPNFNYVFGNRNSLSTKVVLWGGPYLGIGIVGKSNFSGTTISPRGRADSTFSSVSQTFGNGLNRIDYGINVGIGIQVEKFTQIGISYSLGLNNLADDHTFKYYNQSIGVFVNVLFDDIF